MPGKKKLFVKLLQLPIHEVHDLYTQGNIPLAAGYLKATALKKEVLEENDIRIVPRDIANYAGDNAILKWILNENTNIVGFTNYMWNIHRNIHLAKKIKETNPDTFVIFGGPEIDHQHRALKNKSIDAFVIGEGEETFIDLINDIKNGKQLKRVYQSTKPVNLKEIPNPYLEKILFPWQNESMFLETMRGCPYHCKYCFYSNFYSSMRFFPEDYLPELFAMARHYKVPELYFMDPSFNVTPQLEEKLERLQHLNTTDIPIHTEIRLEGVTKDIAQLMKKAGFRSVEAGLQSVNEKSLSAIARSWDKEKFIQGAQLLLEQGIDVKTGIILGLPYDDLKDLEHTLDFVIDLNLAESMEIYPLSLIPGTQLRDEAQSMGITYMPHPPYWVLSTQYMSQKDLKYAVEMMENKLEIEFFPPIIPRFKNVHPFYVHFLDLPRGARTPYAAQTVCVDFHSSPDDGAYAHLPQNENSSYITNLREKDKIDSQLNVLYRHPERIGHSLTILAREDNDITQLVELGRWLRNVSPFTLVQLVIDRNTIPPDEDIKRLSAAFYNPHHYFNHIHHYKADTQGQYSLRFFHLTDNLKIADSYLYQPRYCDLILRYTPGTIEKAREILEEKPILLVEAPLHEEELTELKQIYQGFENFLVKF
jgi:molybdenum cofactor biosynthesis enzyme MoaA